VCPRALSPSRPRAPHPPDRPAPHRSPNPTRPACPPGGAIYLLVGARGGGPPGVASHHATQSGGARRASGAGHTIDKARGVGGPPGGASHHAAGFVGGKGAPRAGHAVDADGGGSLGGAGEARRVLLPGRWHAPWSGRWVEEMVVARRWSCDHHRTIFQGVRQCLQNTGSSQEPGIWRPIFREPLQDEIEPQSCKFRGQAHF
jgi:hypothetical protein